MYFFLFNPNKHLENGLNSFTSPRYKNILTQFSLIVLKNPKILLCHQKRPHYFMDFILFKQANIIFDQDILKKPQNN